MSSHTKNTTSEPSSAAKSRRSAKPRQDPWPAYHEALGRFLIAFADMEILLHLLAYTHAKIPMNVLRSLVGGPRMGDLISIIKRLSALGDASPETLSQNELCFKQLSEISTMRDLLIHRSTVHANGEFMLHDAWSARRAEDAIIRGTSVDLLDNMLGDLRAIALRLKAANSVADSSDLDAEGRAAFSSPWLYKPSQPKTRDQLLKAAQRA